MQSDSKSSWAFGSREMVLAAIFGAMTLVLGGIGFGFIPIANLSGASTFLHLPVILGAIIGGPIVGMICGFIFGGCYRSNCHDGRR
ncbi:MAG TPA: ECF transporter S component, partial [Thermoflexales bacterium]|nr:ECF transporter S component [Thermoflexales bacterium]